MRKAKEWAEDFQVFKVPLEELIECVQRDAFNCGIEKCKENATLIESFEQPKSPFASNKVVTTYIPGKGVKSIRVDVDAFDKLLIKPDDQIA